MTTVLLHEGSAAPKLEPPPRPQVRAVRGGNHGLNRVRHVMRTAVIVLILAVSGGLAISSLMSGATRVPLNPMFDPVSAQLAEAQSEYDYLNTRMNDITSRASLQQVAEGELGLVKADPSQITYVQLEDQTAARPCSKNMQLRAFLLHGLAAVGKKAFEITRCIHDRATTQPFPPASSPGKQGHKILDAVLHDSIYPRLLRRAGLPAVCVAGA